MVVWYAGMVGDAIAYHMAAQDSSADKIGRRLAAMAVAVPPAVPSPWRAPVPLQYAHPRIITRAVDAASGGRGVQRHGK